jgi:HSP20 family protein
MEGDGPMALVPSLFTPGSVFGPTDPFLTLHREMNRLFDDVLRGGPAATTSGQARTGVLLAPSMDVTETDKEVRIQAELPGVTDKDVDVSLNDDVLTVRAEKRQERKEEREGVHFSERAYGTFQRSLRLPFQVNPDQIQARFENGVLNITLPKAPQHERVRRIQVQGAQSSSTQAASQNGNIGSGKTIEGTGTSATAAGGNSGDGSTSGAAHAT